MVTSHRTEGRARYSLLTVTTPLFAFMLLVLHLEERVTETFSPFRIHGSLSELCALIVLVYVPLLFKCEQSDLILPV